MNRREVHDNARGFLQPLADFFAVMRADVIAHEMNRLDGLVNRRVSRCKKGDAFLLTLAWGTLPIDCSRPGLDGRESIQGPAALVCVLMPSGKVPGWRGPCGRETRTRRQGGCLIHGQDDFVIRPWTRVEVDEGREGGIKDGVPWSLGREPAMRAPGLQMRAGQKPPHRGGGDRLHHARRDELVGQCRALPRGQAATQRIRPLAGEASHVDRDLRGENRPWHRGRGRQ
jgi:hypothetical protein